MSTRKSLYVGPKAAWDQGTGWFKGTVDGKSGEADGIHPQVSAPV